MKKLLAMVVGALLASAGQAVVLSWQVNLASGDSSYISAGLFAVEETYIEGVTLENNQSVPVQNTDISSYANTASFYIAMMDNNGNIVAKSETKSYSELQGANHIGELTPPTSLTAWVITSVTTVPEPTSVLLVCLGFAVVALRRRVCA